MAKTAALYETTWRNKFLCSDARTFDEFIARLRAAADELQAMKDAGVEMDLGGAEDDYVSLTTTDAKVAKRFGMERA